MSDQYYQETNMSEPRSEGNEGGEDSSYSGTFSLSYPGTQGLGWSGKKTRKSTYRRPPVRILPMMRERIVHENTTPSGKTTCNDSTCDGHDDSIPLEPMPDTDTFPRITNTLLNSTPMDPPVKPESHSSHKQTKLPTSLLENMEHLSHGMDWLMASGHKNRQTLRQHDQILANSRVIAHSIKLEQNSKETPAKSLSCQSIYVTPTTKECLDVFKDTVEKKNTSHLPSPGNVVDKQPLLSTKKLIPPYVNENGVVVSSYLNSKFQDSVPVYKMGNPQNLSGIKKPLLNHQTPLKHESDIFTRPPLNTASTVKPILRDVINCNIDELHSKTPVVKIQHSSYGDPRVFHRARGLNENKENEINLVLQESVGTENDSTLKPLNLNIRDTNAAQFPKPVVPSIFNSNSGLDLKVLQPPLPVKIDAEKALAAETNFNCAVSPTREEPQPVAIEHVGLPSLPSMADTPSNLAGAHPSLANEKHMPAVSQGRVIPPLISVEMPPPLSKVDPPIKKIIPSASSLLLRPDTSDNKSNHPALDKDLDNVMFSMPIAKSVNNEVIKVKQQTYTILSKLGMGGSSVVYQVMNNKTHDQMAIKRVNLAGVDPASAQGYLNEIQVLKKLQKCESVIRLIDFEYVRKSHTLLVVMEKGDTDFSGLLKDINKTKKISPLMIAYYWSEMLNAVRSIHENGIIHSDLKPANFLLVAGRLKLIDFGIASSLNVDMTSVVKSSIIGTFNYMSPEAVAAGMGQSELGGSKITFKSDIWSLGCILYNLVYGRTPFAEVINGMAKLIKINDPNHVINFPPLAGYPSILITIMKSCLSYNPRDRPTAADLLQYPYLPKLEDPFLMEKIRRVVSPDVWNKIREVSGKK